MEPPCEENSVLHSLKSPSKSTLTESTYTDNRTSYTFTDTASTAGTVKWIGIGSTTARALEAVGKAQLRVLESVLIRRRLSEIHAVLGSKHGGAGEDGQAMCEDLLELSRPVYSSRIRRNAIRLIHIQIVRRETKYLIEALRRWTLAETQSFLLRYFAITLKRDTLTFDSLHILLQEHSSLPTQFLYELAELNAETFWFLASVGLLDAPLNDYLFWTPDRLPSRAFLGTLGATLERCASAYPGARETIAAHPVSLLWPADAPHFPRHRQRVVANISSDRRKAWADVNRRTIMRRLDRILSDYGRYYFIAAADNTTVEEACIDMLELARPGAYDEDITARAREGLQLFLTHGYRRQDMYAAFVDILGEQASSVWHLDHVQLFQDTLRLRVLPNLDGGEDRDGDEDLGNSDGDEDNGVSELSGTSYDTAAEYLAEYLQFDSDSESVNDGLVATDDDAATSSQIDLSQHNLTTAPILLMIDPLDALPRP